MRRPATSAKAKRTTKRRQPAAPKLGTPHSVARAARKQAVAWVSVPSTAAWTDGLVHDGHEWKWPKPNAPTYAAAEQAQAVLTAWWTMLYGNEKGGGCGRLAPEKQTQAAQEAAEEVRRRFVAAILGHEHLRLVNLPTEPVREMVRTAASPLNGEAAILSEAQEAKIREVEPMLCDLGAVVTGLQAVWDGSLQADAHLSDARFYLLQRIEEHTAQLRAWCDGLFPVLAGTSAAEARGDDDAA